MTIESYKALQKLIAEELNVKEVMEIICNTDKGLLTVVYNNERDEVFLQLEDKRINNEKILKEFLKNNSMYDRYHDN